MTGLAQFNRVNNNFVNSVTRDNRLSVLTKVTMMLHEFRDIFLNVFHVNRNLFDIIVIINKLF